MGLRAFAFIYTTITFMFIRNIYADQSASLGYVLIFPIFWIIGGLILGTLFYWKKVRLSSKFDWISLILSTPIPTILFFVIGGVINESPAMTYEYNKNGHRHRIVEYAYRNGKTKRREIFISKDTVTESNPFPVTEAWFKDSVWTYYDEDGNVDKTLYFNERDSIDNVIVHH